LDLSFLHLPRVDDASRADEHFVDTQPLLAAAAQPLALPPSSGFVRYSWVVDPKKQIVGFSFGWVPAHSHRRLEPVAHLATLVRTVEEMFVDRHGGWKLGKATLLFEVSPADIPFIEWGGLPPRRIVLRWRAEDLSADAAPLLKELRARGFNHMLSGCVDEPELREAITHLDVGAGDAAALQACRSFAQHPVRPVATCFGGWPAFDACARHDMAALVPPDVAPPPRAPTRGGLQAEGMLIVRLLQMVQRNEDVRAIEAALKHDAALTFRLLHHINSPAVGAGVQIESLRHAVAMLGYSRLFRFLSMLLSTSDAKSTPPYLTKKAIVRGRFVELLGQGLLGASHSDNLFLVGMFSLLDQILGVPMASLLEQVQLADAVRLAIIGEDGLYGPFLKLATACEAGATEAEALADSVFISPGQVNAARLGAIAWSQEISRSDAMY
jgi:hypothetical protein